MTEEHLPRLSFEDIVAAPDLDEKAVDIPEWGGSVLLRTLSAKRGDTLRSGAGKPDDEDFDVNFEVSLIASTVVEPEMTPEMVRRLREKSIVPYTTLLAEVLRLNGMAKEVRDSTKAEFPEERPA